MLWQRSQAEPGERGLRISFRGIGIKSVMLCLSSAGFIINGRAVDSSRLGSIAAPAIRLG